MLPSIRIIVLTAAAGPIFLAGVMIPALTGIGAVYVAILVVYALLDRLMLVKPGCIAITRIAPARLSLGSPCRIVLEVENRSRRRVWLQLAEDLSEGLESAPPRCEAVLAPGQRRELEYRLTARQRGQYVLDRLDVRILPMLGLFYRQFQFTDSTTVDVYPNLVDLKKHELLIRRGLTHEMGLARLRQIGQGADFESLRPYSTDDPISRVDWKATAKRDELIVRNYEPERRQSVLVAIDAGRATAGEFAGMSRLDYLVNAALMLAYVTLRQGDWFSLVAFSDKIESYLPPVRRLANINQVARALYELEPNLVESDYGTACRFLDLKNRKRSLICLMTDVIDRQANDQILGYMARFARRHLPLAVTLADPYVGVVAEEPLGKCTDVYAKAAALDVLTSRREALMFMRQRGVDVLDAHPESLGVELINRYLLIKATRRL